MTETIDFSKSEQYTLSIRLSTDGFSFSVLNPLEDDAPWIESHAIDESLSLTANLKRTYREVEWLSLPYRRVNVLSTNRRFTFIPLDFFEDEQAEQIFYHNHLPRENEQVLYNILYASNVVVLFGIDQTAYSFLQERHPQARFYSQTAPLIEFFSNKSRLGNSRKMYVNLHKKNADLYCYERNQLLLANTYPCAVTADRIYYLLYIWKQLEFNQERDELHLSGFLDEKELLLGELRKYIRQVFIMNPVENIDLYAINQCE